VSLKIIGRYLTQLKNKIALMVARGAIASVSDSASIQLVQAGFLADEVKDKVESFGHFGLVSVPPASGTECIGVSVSGSRDNMVIVATENRQYRKKGLPPGTSGLYNKNQKYILLKENNIEMLLSKIKVENDQHELIAVLVELIEKIVESKNITGIGPQPLTADSIAAINAVKTKLETFKV